MKLIASSRVAPSRASIPMLHSLLLLLAQADPGGQSEDPGTTCEAALPVLVRSTVGVANSSTTNTVTWVRLEGTVK